MSAMSGKLRVFHDASCPICRAEMEELGKVDDDGVLELIDCSADDFSDDEAALAGLEQQDLLSAMYVQDDSGRWYQGPDAFAEIYGRLGIERMAGLWGSRPLRPFVNFGYRLFLMLRGVLVSLGGARVVRWLVRREARHAAKRATHCSTDRDD